MVRLGASERAGLPDRAFAYVDSVLAGDGCRSTTRLMSATCSSRFGQVAFENEVALDLAVLWLVAGAAKKYRIVPIGFIAGQLQVGNAAWAVGAIHQVALPSGGFLGDDDVDRRSAPVRDAGCWSLCFSLEAADLQRSVTG